MLLPAYFQPAIKALHEDTHTYQQHTLIMAQDWYLLLAWYQAKFKDTHKQIELASFLPEMTGFKTGPVDLVDLIRDSKSC